MDSEILTKKVLVLKRDPDLRSDVFDIPLPEDGKTLVIKAMTYPILLPQGIYMIAGWDVGEKKPGMLFLNHTLFPAMRRWVRDFMQPIQENVFEIVPSRIGGVVQHDLISLGRSMRLDEEEGVRMKAFLDDMLGEIEVPI